MRKLKLFFACLLMAVFSIGQVWAGEVTYSLTPDATSTGSSATSYQASLSFTYEGVSWTMAQINPSTRQTKTNQSSATAEFNFHNTSAFPGRITKVVVTYSALTVATGKASEFKFLGGTSEVTATTGGDAATWNSTNKTMTWTPAANTNYTYFAYYMNGKTATGSNYLAESDAIVVTYDDGQGGGSDPVAVTGVTLDQSEAEVAVGKTITLTPTVAPSNATTKTVTWESDDEDVATVDGGVVTGVAEGTATITVKTTDGNKTATCEVTVTAAPAAVNYEKVTAEPADWSGEYILVYEADATNARVWKGADEANNYAEATIATGVIAAPEGAAVLTIAKVAESDPVVYTIQVGSKYIGQTSNSNGIKIQDAAINNSISYNGTDAAVDIVASSAHLRYNSASSSYFRYYKSSSYSSQKKIQLYKKVDGTVKPAAGLAYAEADQKNLIKFGAAFTAPTLSTADGFNGIVTYASSNTEVAEVAANGAVTIKTVGVAEITASFAGNDDFKAGSASYTIGVTNHAGTEADPYVAADVKIAIDAMGTVENAYATGVVSNVVTTTLPQDGYITFYFSADGTTTDQVEAYKCYGLNSAPFEAVSDVVTGATVVVTGNLKKFNSTYEFDQNCHLVSYTAPAAQKQSIANDQANPYTVAQALVYAADGVTYDLDDYVYVRGVVYDVKSFDNGAMNIFIKDANAENQFELYKCAGINDGSSTTPFEALSDVQVGNIVIGYGQLTVFNTTYEFKQGNYLVDLQTPATGIELDATAEVEVGNNVNLTATILPSNATGTIVWSVESGDAYASVDGGVVTGIAEGEAVIRATVQGTEIFAECTVTVSAAAPVLTDYYEKVTETADITDGTYLIVYEADGLAFNGGLTTLDAESNTIAVAITNDNKIGVTEATAAATFFIDVTAGSILAANGKYIGVSSYGNGLKTSETSDYTNAFAIDGDGNAVISIYNATWNKGSEGTMILRYNSASGQTRFRYYKEGGQQSIALYKLANETVKANPELAWDPADDIVLTVDDEFTAPTLTYAQGFDGLEAVVITSSNTALAQVNAGVVSLVAEATGEATITATFAGNDNYKAATASYKITVNAVAPTPAETKNVVILAEYNSKFYAMTNSLTSGALAGVEVEKDGSKIVVSSAEDKAAIQWTATVDGDNTTLKDGDDYYIKGSSGASLSLEADPYNWNWDGEKSCYISSAYTNRGLFFSNSGNVFKGYALSNITSDGYAATEVIEIDPEDIVISSKVDPALAYSPASDEITAGDAWSAPVLGYVEGFDGLAAITYESSNEAVATVTDAGVIALAGGTGTATITATFAGNASYLAGSATYTVKVNEPAEDCDGTDDFLDTEDKGSPTSYTNRSTPNGWSATNAGYKVIDEKAYWMINGKTTAYGVITSPELTGGLGSLKFRYANTNSESNGVSVKIEIKQGGDVVKEYTLTKPNSEVTQNEVYTELIENINVAGTFQIVITNLSPSNNTGNKDRVSIGRFCWTSYTAPEPVLTWEDGRTGLTIGNYYTICLPKKVTHFRGASIWDMKKRNSTETEVYLEEAELPFAAGTPFIIQATAEKLEVVYEGDETSTPVESGALRGTLTGLDVDAFAALTGNIYILKDNAIRPRTTGNWLSANRAYIVYTELVEVSEAPHGAPGKRVRAIPMQPQVTTGMDELNASEKPVKLMIDGQLFILRGDKLYDATGRLVK